MKRYLPLFVLALVALSIDPATAGKPVKPAPAPTVVNTNCGSLCGGGIVCLAKQPDGSYLTTNAVAGIAAGLKVQLITLSSGAKCWLPVK